MRLAVRWLPPLRLFITRRCIMGQPLPHNRISRFVVSGSKRGFLEEKPVDIVKGNMGWIEVVVGPMFSGKSEELIRRRRRQESHRQHPQKSVPRVYASTHTPTRISILTRT